MSPGAHLIFSALPHGPSFRTNLAQTHLLPGTHQAVSLFPSCTLIKNYFSQGDISDRLFNLGLPSTLTLTPCTHSLQCLSEIEVFTLFDLTIC